MFDTNNLAPMDRVNTVGNIVRTGPKSLNYYFKDNVEFWRRITDSINVNVNVFEMDKRSNNSVSINVNVECI